MPPQFIKIAFKTNPLLECPLPNIKIPNITIIIKIIKKIA
jgi:hypothetical protein